jgi:hypothetical protein
MARCLPVGRQGIAVIELFILNFSWRLPIMAISLIKNINPILRFPGFYSVRP